MHVFILGYFSLIVGICNGLKGFSYRGNINPNSQDMININTTISQRNLYQFISRDIDFWSRSMDIFSSYKTLQAKLFLQSFLDRFGLNNTIIDNTGFDRQSDFDEDCKAWNDLHETNSQKMVNLCLDLRGFYLKAGQFLGTRHDFMPIQYTSKLSKLHDDVPSLPEYIVKTILEDELKGNLVDYFDSINLKEPIGSASIAQVHVGIWKPTKQKVAVKIQYPNAYPLMKRDLSNLRKLAEFLQRTELKFDLLTCVKELQKRIVNEFDFLRESSNLEYMQRIPDVEIPKTVFATEKVLIMSYIEGENLSRLAEFKDKKGIIPLPQMVKKKFGRVLLDRLGNAWGYQIFVLKRFNADPHPGNICVQSNGNIGLLDWGQVCSINDELLYKFALMNKALNSNDRKSIATALVDLGLEFRNPRDFNSMSDIGITMLDTRNVAGYVINPFKPGNALKANSVVKFPSDLYFLVRAVQLMRGISYGFKLDYSLAKTWEPYATAYLESLE